MSQLHPIRIAICQPLLAHYRVPVFELLGRQPGIELTVLAGRSAGSLDAINGGKHFRTVDAPIRPVVKSLITQPVQLDAVSSGNYDLVILSWDIHYLSMFRTVSVGRRKRVPVVLWGHGYSKHRSHALFSILRNRIGRSAAGVMLYTKTIADRLIQSHGFRADRVFVAQNAIDQESIQNARKSWLARPGELTEFQRTHGLDPTQTIIFVSRLEQDNAIDMLIKAAHEIRQRKPNLKLILIGKGPDRPRLEALTAQLGLQETVIFTDAIYDDMQLAPWMLSSTVFCYPQNIGLSLHHALGFGVPAITSDDIASQNPEIEAIQDGTNGFLYQHGNIIELAAKCEHLMDHPGQRATMSTAAIETVLQRYSIANMVQGFLDATVLVDGQRRTVV